MVYDSVQLKFKTDKRSISPTLLELLLYQLQFTKFRALHLRWRDFLVLIEHLKKISTKNSEQKSLWSYSVKLRYRSTNGWLSTKINSFSKWINEVFEMKNYWELYSTFMEGSNENVWFILHYILQVPITIQLWVHWDIGEMEGIRKNISRSNCYYQCTLTIFPLIF